MKRRIDPPELAPPIGFAHGWLVETPVQHTLYLAGQCAHDGEGRIVAPGDLVAQFDRALANVVVVLEAAGMEPGDLVQLELFVRRRDDYVRRRKELGAVWRRHFGKHYPAMALFEITGLLDEEALVEVRGVAVRIPE